MNLGRALKITRGDIVSIVGAGGKTTLMFQLASEFRSEYKVLVTTTTKIYVPSPEQYDYLCIDESEFEKYILKEEKGIYILGVRATCDDKLVGLDDFQLDKIYKHFDIILVEADGAKMKQLKGWKDTEPIIYRRTTKTVGMIDISSLGKVVSEDIIHRLDKFLELVDTVEGKCVRLDDLVNVIINPCGLFKDSLGEKVLFINKADDKELQARALELAERLTKFGSGSVERIIVGSLLCRLILRLGEGKSTDA